MPQFNTLAIVLRRTHYAETDNILTLYSRDHGKLQAIAKGARKAISRLSGATDPLTCCKFAIATGRGSLQVVTQAEVLNSFPGLAADVRRMAHAQYFAELLSNFTAEHDPHPEIYKLLIRSLSLVEKAEDLETISRWYELNLLSELGYAPDLYSCGVCGKDLRQSLSMHTEGVYALAASQGYALCRDHANPRNHSDHSGLSSDALAYLLEITDAPEKSSAVCAIRPATVDAEDQARSALRKYIQYRLDKDLKSVAFLDSLRLN